MTEAFLKKKKKYQAYLEIANEHGHDTVTEFICESYQKEGLSSNQISKTLGLYPSAILNVLKNNGVKITGKKTISIDSFSLDNFAQVDKYFFYKQQCDLSSTGYTYISEALCDLYFNKRNTMDEIGEILGMTVGKVSYMINKMCLPLRAKGGKTYSKLTDDLKSQIFEDFKSIEPSYKNIQQYCLEKEIKLSPKTIQRFLRIAERE